MCRSILSNSHSPDIYSRTSQPLVAANRPSKQSHAVADSLGSSLHLGRFASLSYPLLFMRAHGGADGCYSGCLEVGRGRRVNDGSVGCLSVYRH